MQILFTSVYICYFQRDVCHQLQCNLLLEYSAKISLGSSESHLEMDVFREKRDTKSKTPQHKAFITLLKIIGIHNVHSYFLSKWFTKIKCVNCGNLTCLRKSRNVLMFWKDTKRSNQSVWNWVLGTLDYCLSYWPSYFLSVVVSLCISLHCQRLEVFCHRENSDLTDRVCSVAWAPGY